MDSGGDLEAGTEGNDFRVAAKLIFIQQMSLPVNVIVKVIHTLYSARAHHMLVDSGVIHPRSKSQT